MLVGMYSRAEHRAGRAGLASLPWEFLGLPLVLARRWAGGADLREGGRSARTPLKLPRGEVARAQRERCGKGGAAQDQGSKGLSTHSLMPSPRLVSAGLAQGVS